MLLLLTLIARSYERSRLPLCCSYYYITTVHLAEYERAEQRFTMYVCFVSELRVCSLLSTSGSFFFPLSLSLSFYSPVLPRAFRCLRVQGSTIVRDVCKVRKPAQSVCQVRCVKWESEICPISTFSAADNVFFGDCDRSLLSCPLKVSGFLCVFF